MPTSTMPLGSESVPDYPADVLAHTPERRVVAQIPAERDLVVETADGAFCGAVVGVGRAVDAGERRDTVTLEDRHGRLRVFPMLAAAFLVDGVAVTLVRPAPGRDDTSPRRTASGSFSAAPARARVARGSRIWVEGVHDAALVERIWGDDLRVEGVVVEPLGGVDDLGARVDAFGPGPERRIGVLVDHLIPGSKESRIAAGVRSEHVLVTGHPYVDIWQAVRPTAIGIDEWPAVPRSVNWKDGVTAALGADNPRELWRRVLAGVDRITDVEVPLRRAVEELIDFVT